MSGGPWGVTPNGFVPKPYAQILTDIETAQEGSMDPGIDLSPTGPQGRQNAIVANMFAALWQLLGNGFNSFNRQAVEGAGLDNIGDLTGDPREGGSYTQVPCTLGFSSAVIGDTYAAGELIANVNGSTSQAYANLAPVTVTSTTMPDVLMQSLVIGATPTVTTGALTVITNPTTGWLSITNPGPQTQLGANAEIDPDYSARQKKELGSTGSCNLTATLAALVALGAAQTPPTSVSPIGAVNTTRANIPYGALTLIPNSYAVVVYPDPATWASGDASQLVGNAIWKNKPAGNAPIGQIAITVEDPYLGQQIVYYSVPTPETVYVSVQIVVRPGFIFSNVASAVQTALVAASLATTPVDGVPPTGQLLPGQDVLFGQLYAVIMGVPGVSDIQQTGGVQQLFFDVVASPTNQIPVPIGALQVATLGVGNITVSQGAGP